MSPARTPKVRAALAQARRALGHSEDGDGYSGLPPTRPGKVEPTPITWVPPQRQVLPPTPSMRPPLWGYALRLCSGFLVPLYGRVEASIQSIRLDLIAR